LSRAGLPKGFSGDTESRALVDGNELARVGRGLALVREVSELDAALEEDLGPLDAALAKVTSELLESGGLEGGLGEGGPGGGGPGGGETSLRPTIPAKVIQIILEYRFANAEAGNG
jgi:hypothetical protein